LRGGRFGSIWASRRDICLSEQSVETQTRFGKREREKLKERWKDEKVEEVGAGQRDLEFFCRIREVRVYR